MRFAKEQVGYRNSGSPINEYRLVDGNRSTGLLVLRMNPDAGGGWVVYDEADGTGIADAYRLVDAKALAVREAEARRERDA